VGEGGKGVKKRKSEEPEMQARELLSPRLFRLALNPVVMIYVRLYMVPNFWFRKYGQHRSGANYTCLLSLKKKKIQFEDQISLWASLNRKWSELKL
jgi:hypothetical protein